MKIVEQMCLWFHPVQHLFIPFLAFTQARTLAEIGQGSSWLALWLLVTINDPKEAVEILKHMKGLRITKRTTHEVSLCQDF